MTDETPAVSATIAAPADTVLVVLADPASHPPSTALAAS
jgi:hypothetical protein